MAQATILAAGNAAASSAPIAVAAGAKVTVGLFVAAGGIPSNAQFQVVEATPGADLPLPLVLSPSSPRIVLDSPGTYKVNRITGGSALARGAVPDGHWFYRVTAVNAQGESLPSNEQAVALSDSNNTVTVSWAAVTGAVTYNVYRGTAAGGESTVATGVAGTSYVDTNTMAAGTPPAANTSALAAPVQAASSTATAGGALAAGTYYYVVTATNALGETLKSNEQSQVTTGSASTVTVNWALVPGATGYKIYRGTVAGAEGTFFTVGAVATFTDTGAAGTAGTPPVTNTTGLTTPVQAALVTATPGVVTPASVGVFTES